MDKISVLNVSHYKREYNSYHAKNEHGFGPDIFLFVHFISPAVVIIDGVEYITDKNACIIYPPDQRHEYMHINDDFLNGFLIFKTKDPYLLSRYSLPGNEIFYVSNGDEITNLLELITYSITDKLIDRTKETERHIVNFFAKLSELCINNNPNQKRMFEIRQRFIALRDEVRSDPQDWTVEKMAKYVWFTRSRFTVLYREFFNISPSDDLIDAKMKYAQQLLETTDLSVAEISKSCGYKSVEHFIRIFNKNVKYTPYRYRKKARAV